jgi:uncharacterized integral membrane protein
MSARTRTRTTNDGIAGVSYRTIAGLVLVVLVVVFIALNRDDTKISFIIFDSTTSLWVALAAAAGAGFAGGFLLGRRRYRS